MPTRIIVLSLGGSVLVPSGIDIDFLRNFSSCIRANIREHRLGFIIVVGGGRVARDFQHAYRVVAAPNTSEEEDWIGIEATRLNARLVKAVFGADCPGPVLMDPTKTPPFVGPVIVAAGWKPGFSTDYDAVLLAERYGANRIINLSNIRHVYTANPSQDPHAVPCAHLSWQEFQSIVGTKWEPGRHSPFDPIASQKASELNLQVVIIHGCDLDNLSAVISDAPFVGTTIE